MIEKKSVLKSIRYDNEKDMLLCPICDFDFVHPISVRVATDNDYTFIDHKGTHLSHAKMAETDEARKNRGVIISIEYCCEHGHLGIVILAFHKGITFVKHKELPLIDDWTTLWRD